jgi:hypothetical protein
VGGWGAVNVGVDQHVVIEPVDRVVERGGMEAKLDPRSVSYKLPVCAKRYYLVI